MLSNAAKVTSNEIKKCFPPVPTDVKLQEVKSIDILF